MHPILVYIFDLQIFSPFSSQLVFICEEKDITNLMYDFKSLEISTSIAHIYAIIHMTDSSMHTFASGFTEFNMR